jgi:PleD family two-component response regulator
MPGEVHSRIVSRRVLAFLLDLEIAKAQRLQYHVSVLCLRPDEGKADDGVLNRIAHGVLEAVRVTDLVALLPPEAVALMAIDADVAAIPSMVDRITERLQGVCQIGGELIATTWSVGCASYPKNAPTGTALLDEALHLMASAYRQGGDRIYIAE